METKTMTTPRISVKNLRTEYLENPLGIDVPRPRLSWQDAGEGRNIMQEAYQVQVAQDAAQLGSGRDLLWDSGKVTSDNSTYIQYGGRAGQSGQRCFWHVRVWDQDDQPSNWSEPAWWEMGLLEEKEWRADWIEVDWEEDPKAFKPCPFFRRSFALDQPVQSARLYVTSHGLYEAWLNGKRVGDQVFTPGYTPYDKQLQYQVYDVTALLKEGENALGAILGDGWYRGKVYVANNRNVYGARLGLLALLRVETIDAQVIVATDSQWKVTTGPIVKSDMRDGEIYDARLEMPDWCNAGFDDSAWQGVRVVLHPKNHLVASMGVPVRRKETFHPTILKTPNGETVLDFGQNLAGVVHMKVRGPKGTTIHLQHGETLDKGGNFTIANLLITKPKDGKMRPFQDVYYTLKGEGEEEYEPRFAVHGFRYVKLEGFPGEPKPEDFYSVAIYSDMPPTGTFECSDQMINQLHHNVEWSMKSNFLDLPTDCPQRERAGWTGDAQIFATSASFLMDTRAFLRKWLKELSLEQFPDGKVGNFVPNPYRLATGIASSFFRMLDGSAGWGDVAVMMPWDLYWAFGDSHLLEHQYESMKAWVDFVQERARKVNWAKKFSPRFWSDKTYRARQRYNVDTGYHWGEWLEPGASLGGETIHNVLKGNPLVATAYLVHSARTLAKTAALLGKEDDAAKYNALVERVKAAYIAEFIGKDGRIQPDRQASYVRVLVFDLLTDELKPAIVGHLVRLIRSNGNHIGTGFLSTVFLCQVLAENGHLDVAYDLLTQKTIPSWLYAVTKGATTIWETWEGISEDGSPKASLNHYSPGAVINFLHRTVAGIEAAEPGYRRITIHPQPGGGLTGAKAAYESVQGLIVSEWEKKNGRMHMDVTIPANTRAVAILPGANASQVMESSLPVSEAEGIKNLVQSGTDVQMELGSGVYRFEYPVR
ncbi:MAG: glycoside hydrolase family 78 protein [Anaerolineae bacterium]|nr:glycoside hydrolase family 78 protein [Anaerolineae bacterium]